jgi:DNA/RNA-binding domain of Phe-tRNA-synthetase-like protein
MVSRAETSGYKPSGRGKPAQEYLLRTAQTPDQWPVILNAVDLLNVVSLRSGLPISLVALDRLQPPLLVRYGRSGESFVFNQAGQVLDVTGLICICHTVQNVTQPVGTPVKDSQLAKVTLSDSQVLACLFAPRSAVPAERLQFWTEQLAEEYRQWCTPEDVETQLLPSSW